MSLEAKGKLYVKYDAQQVTEKFKKREFVLEMTSGAYSEYIKFQLTQDKCALLDKYKVGDEVNVKFNLRGRPYQGKTGETTYFTNLEAWSVDTVSSAANTPKSFDTPMPSDKDMNFSSGAADDDDSLPF